MTIGVLKYRIDLAKPLLILKANKGFLACGYVNVNTCNVTQEACALVRGVLDFDEMLSATVCEVSKSAYDMGVRIGMLGKDVMALFDS